MADGILKRCPRCAADKPISAFYKQGRACYCIPCEKAYKQAHYLANADRIKEKSRAWTASNPERKSATDRAYRKANPERRAANSRAWVANNPARRKSIYSLSRKANLAAYRAREAAYRERNRAACNARISEWKSRNPHAIVAYAGKRRAAEVRAIPAWANLDAIAAIYARSQAQGMTVDHAVPLLSEFVCGLHCEANLQLLTLAENSRKNNRHWPDMWTLAGCEAHSRLLRLKVAARFAGFGLKNPNWEGSYQ
jgi:hypothetical protein